MAASGTNMRIAAWTSCQDTAIGCTFCALSVLRPARNLCFGIWKPVAQFRATQLSSFQQEPDVPVSQSQLGCRFRDTMHLQSAEVAYIR
jgi:hypothetical protein